MQRWGILLALGFLLGLLTGCSGDKDRGKYKNKDRPVREAPEQK
jgi:hypothetical protein